MGMSGTTSGPLSYKSSNFFLKGPHGKYFSIMGCMLSATTIHLCSYSLKVVVDNKLMDEHACVPIKFYSLNKSPAQGLSFAIRCLRKLS